MRTDFIGTNDQWVTRQERIGIMVFDGKIPEQEAINFCNERPVLYGYQKKGDSHGKSRTGINR